MKEARDTIAAIATAPGEAGISIVRISGAESLAIADRIFRGSGPPPSERADRQFLHGYVHGCLGRHDRDRLLDEVILLLYRAPHSYTRQDVVEIQGHGGRAACQRILRAALNAGARLAEPGEFTRLAFLNGRIDLLQAEAVADLIRARSDRAASAATEQLDGRLSSLFARVYDKLIAVAADLEATLDFPDGELPVSTLPDILQRLGGAISRLQAVLETWEEGHLLREGAKVVISGSPNVGKSTVLNALLGKDRAIVTAVSGTTRDTIEEEVVIHGIPIRLVDTAGLRNSECHIEREGIQRAQASVSSADLVLHVVDASCPLDSADSSRVADIEEKRCIVLLNKSDLDMKVTSADFPGFIVVVTSATLGRGMDNVRAGIATKLGIVDLPAPHAVISERHRQLCQYALNELNECSALLSHRVEDAVVPATTVLRGAIEHLSEITGKTYTNDLLDRIFSQFCVGK